MNGCFCNQNSLIDYSLLILWSTHTGGHDFVSKEIWFHKMTGHGCKNHHSVVQVPISSLQQLNFNKLPQCVIIVYQSDIIIFEN